MDGVIILDKPTGITSAKALYRVRKATGQKKSGHAGTLDPGASGVLILCLGKATKLVEAMMDQPKVYRATARLDVTSESLDSDSPLKDVVTGDIPTREAIVEAFKTFEGVIQQVPPRISAIKIKGQPAYKLARRSQDFELKARSVKIHWIEVHAYRWPDVEFEMCCGRGTYVRSLIRDLGERLKTGGCLTGLLRRSVGPFGQADARTFEEIEAATATDSYLIGLEEARAAVTRRPIEIPTPPG